MKSFLICYLILALCALLYACSGQSITPAQHVENLRFELRFVKGACAIYKIDQTYPRDAEVSAECDKLK
jgi:hypothetical protein